MAININLQELAIFFSILLRLSLVLFMLPVFNSAQVPGPIKLCISVALALVFFPALRQSVPPLPLDGVRIVPVVLGELVFGIVFALSLMFVFSAFDMAGEIIGFQMGFGFAQVADPQTGARSPVLGLLCQLVALLIFLGSNGHHVVLRLFADSFQTLPIGAFSVDPSLYGKVLSLSANLFILSIKLAAPVVAVLLLIQLGLGLMAKFAPQMNILATSFPITIIAGLIFFGLAMLLWAELAARFLGESFIFLKKLTG
jgi:flagellar biosynthesis protein FliR